MYDLPPCSNMGHQATKFPFFRHPAVGSPPLQPISLVGGCVPVGRGEVPQASQTVESAYLLQHRERSM